MRGNNVFTKLRRKVRAGNLVFRRRELSRAETEQYLIGAGYKKDTPLLDNGAAARRSAKKNREVLAKERKKIRARNKKTAQK